MHYAPVVFGLVVLAVSCKAQGPVPVPISLPVPTVSCAAVTCIVGQECRIVLQADGSLAALCLDPDDIPSDAGESQCGESGSPLLEASSGQTVRIGYYTYRNRRRRVQPYSLFRAGRRRPCPAPLVRKNNVCCADTEKEGVCPIPHNVPCGGNGYCEGDNYCPGPQKCCPSSCDKRTCVPPATSKVVCDTANCIPGLPCAILDCAPGFFCVDGEYGPECIPQAGCELIDCQPDFTCIDFPSGPSCVPISNTCDVVPCDPGTFCVNTENGAECRPIGPGTCPPPFAAGEGLSVCVTECASNSDCSDSELCCPLECGGRVCVPPVPPITCASVLCIIGSVCVETADGPECRLVDKPGICPATPSDVLIDGGCPNNCVNDADCGGTEKCCDVACGGRTCVPAISCAITFCAGETRCVETPDGPTCVPIENPGNCPATPSDFLDEGVCPNNCESDADCESTEKCCDLACGGRACVPVISCANVLCSFGTTCIETDDGPTCVLRKPGNCPAFGCIAIFPPPPCDNECRVDDDCEGQQRCCVGCFNCRTCVDPEDLPPTCDDVSCAPNEVCILQEVVCVTAPCDPVPTCVERGFSIGECPAVNPDDGVSCSSNEACGSDADCGLSEKCCDTGCGSPMCAPASTLLSCQLVRCRPGFLCREIYDPVTGQVFPVCRVPPVVFPTPFNPCALGFPLLNPDDSDVFCGRGPGSVACPQRYGCNIAPTDEFAVCCRNAPFLPPPGPEKPGECPEPVGPGICAFLCSGDNSCPGDQKCCRTGCNGLACTDPVIPPPVSNGCPQLQCPGQVGTCRGRSECQRDSDCNRGYGNNDQVCCLQCNGCSVCRRRQPSPPRSCADIRCPRGEECVENDGGPQCVPSTGPGSCPQLRCADRPCRGRDECQTDRDCNRYGATANNRKCCRGCSGCLECLVANPVPTCQSFECPVGEECRDTDNGPECVVPKPGICLPFPCPPPPFPPPECTNQCDLDADCPGDQKCCVGCFNCRVCADPFITPPQTCEDVTCPPLEECVETDTGPRCQLPRSVCSLPPVTGPCRARFENYYFNPETNDCELFIYGGCQGNANRFETKEECLNACGPPPGIIVCSLPVDPGPCTALNPSFYYNSETQTCDPFNYGGCLGNANRFISRPACLRRCSPIPDSCLLPSDSGNCLGLFPRFYFNSESGDCESFTYGGCGGNANNYETQEDCREECVPNYCSLPSDPGPCEALVPSYYYDPASNSCRPFNYGGCQGNANRFPDRRSCEQACRQRQRQRGSATYA